MKRLSLTATLVVLGWMATNVAVLGQAGKDKRAGGNSGRTDTGTRPAPVPKGGSKMNHWTKGQKLGTAKKVDSQGKTVEALRIEGKQKLDDAQNKALGKLIRGAPLEGADQKSLSVALASPMNNLSEELRNFIREGLERERLDQVCRKLHVQNDTGELLLVSVQYFTTTENKTRRWFPGDPEKAGDALTYTIKPNQTAELIHEDGTVCASRVRLWAKSAKHEWLEYKDKDLLLNRANDNKASLKNPEEPFVFSFR
jgi:hypothetical protein